MVLEKFGQKITQALRDMQNETVIDEKVMTNLLRTITVALLQADVNVKLVKQLTINIKDVINLEESKSGRTNKRKLIQTTIIKELYKLLDSGGRAKYELKKGKTNVVMFVGLQGSGKTTTCNKYAYYLRNRGWKVALVCADTFRAGAFDQLKQNATKSNIPYYGSYTERDPVVVAEQGVEQFRSEGYEVIIVDTSGRHKQEEALFEEMQEVAKVVQPDDIVFTMDSSIGQAARDQAVAFKNSVDVGSVIVTKLDGNAKGGGALSAVAATKSPIIFIGTGEHVEAFEAFDTKSFVSRLLGMGDIDGLLKLFQEKKLMDNPGALMGKLMKGQCDFTFRDMQEQFQNLLKLGPLSQVMSMIPGLSQMMQGQGDDSENKIQKFISIMHSMNEQELDSDHKLMNAEPNRIKRIARGAGSHPVIVEQVLSTLKPFKGVAERISQMTKGGGQMDPSKMASMLPPGMMKQMGGMQGIQNMMKQMGMGGGGPGGMDPAMMQKMMAQMGGMGGGGGMPRRGQGRR